MRIPFDPPYTKEDLPQLDSLHAAVGLYDLWINSDARKELAGGKMRKKGFEGPVSKVLILDEIEEM